MSRFEIYKKGQGVTARWITAVSVLAFGVLGCYRLENWLSVYESVNTRGLSLLGMRLTLPMMISAVVFAALAAATALLVNYPRFVDYLINSEAELRKVAWPTRNELKRQTLVVIFTLVVFGVLLLAVDVLFGWISQRVLYGA